MAIIRRPVRSRPIRLFLISMFAVPLVSLIGLWAFAASVTVPTRSATTTTTSVAGPLPARGRRADDRAAHRAARDLPLAAQRPTGREVLAARHEGARSPGCFPAAEATLLAGSGQLLARIQGGPERPGSRPAGHPGHQAVRRCRDDDPAGRFPGVHGIIDAQFQFYYAETLDQGSLAAGDRRRRHRRGAGARDGQPGGTLVDGALRSSTARWTPPPGSCSSAPRPAGGSS